MKCCSNLLDNFFMSIELVTYFFVFIVLLWCILLIDLLILSHPRIPEINPIWCHPLCFKKVFYIILIFLNLKASFVAHLFYDLSWRMFPTYLRIMHVLHLLNGMFHLGFRTKVHLRLSVSLLISWLHNMFIV